MGVTISQLDVLVGVSQFRHPTVYQNLLSEKIPAAARGRGGTGKGQEPALSRWGLCPCGCLAPVLQQTAERDGGGEGKMKLSREEQSGLKLHFLLAVSYYYKTRS